MPSITTIISYGLLSFLALLGIYIIARVVSRAATKSYLETMDEHKQLTTEKTNESKLHGRNGSST